ncbi:MAG: helix-turn-helix domain-containing protein [Bacteroidia bacterium]|nr:helix-turn-helix domain-containing protein [Bacteroidia bacterium]
MDKIAANIKVLREFKRLSQEQLAEQLKITRARLGAYEEGRNEPPVELLLKISDFFRISVDALLKGDFSRTDPGSIMKIGRNRLLFPIVIDRNGRDVIEVVPIRARAGYLNGFSDPEFVGDLQRMSLPFMPTGKHRAFAIQGDSMPPVKEGSYVVGKYVEELEDIKDGYTYVLVTKEEGIVYKRVYQSPHKDGSLLLHSDNKEYSPYKVKADDVFEAWEFTCCINIGGYKPEELNPESIMNMLKSMKVEIEKIKK